MAFGDVVGYRAPSVAQTVVHGTQPRQEGLTAAHGFRFQFFPVCQLEGVEGKGGACHEGIKACSVTIGRPLGCHIAAESCPSRLKVLLE